MPRSLSIVIPVRLESQRLPRKPLRDVAGQPLIRRVWDWVAASPSASEILIVTDSPEVAETARGFGARVHLAPSTARSGTARIAAALERVAGDRVVNVQGDQICEPSLLNVLLDAWHDPHIVITPWRPLASHELPDDPDIVKVEHDSLNRVVTFSRSPIPSGRGCPGRAVHVGVYALPRTALLAWHQLPHGLAARESLEQLALVEAGWPIQTFRWDGLHIAVDNEDSLARAAHTVTRGTP